MLGTGLPAAAETRPSPGPDVYAWGSEVVAFVQLVQPEENPATVIFVNRLTYHPEEARFTLEIDGMRVDVQLLMGPSNQPDLIRVLSPMSYMAEPESLSVAEGETGCIEVFYLSLS
jgi:hypothetical protein